PRHEKRQEEILRERDLELSGYLEPLGIQSGSGFFETERLMAVTANICEEVGLRFKARFSQPRPSEVEPLLMPFIPDPPHSSYPSNHAFQSMAIARVFALAVPEHPANPALFERAVRIAENREWAGVHFSSDTKAGFDLARNFIPVLKMVLSDQMSRVTEEWL
ncbi:MAG: phosphatase PAP2 family protein, partial [Pseudomonadota bacterium]